MSKKSKKKNDSKIHLRILRSILIGTGLYISMNVYMTILLLGLLAYSICDLIFASRGLMPARPLGLSKRFKILFTTNLTITFFPSTWLLIQLDPQIDWIKVCLILIARLGFNFGLCWLLIRHFKHDAMKIQDYIMKRFTKWVENHFSD